MTADAELSPELESTLKRYLEIQNDEQRLQEEKAVLQEKLAAHMEQRRMAYWYPELDGQRLKVRLNETPVVEYDEQRLRVNLKDRYGAILAPDLKKIRRHLSEIAGSLAPVMDLIGSPSPDKVREAIERGIVRKEEFAGAFRKTVKRVVAVMKARADETAGAAPL